MIRVGDRVQVNRNESLSTAGLARDSRKRDMLGCRKFVGNAANYMSPHYSYEVVSTTKTGGLRLKGFLLTVSPKNVVLVSSSKK